MLQTVKSTVEHELLHLGKLENARLVLVSGTV